MSFTCTKAAGWTPVWRVYVCVWETQGEFVYFRVWLTASALWTNSLTAAPDTCEFLVTSFWCDFKPVYTVIKEWNQWVKTKQFLPADSFALLPHCLLPFLAPVDPEAWEAFAKFLKVWRRYHKSSNSAFICKTTKHDDYQNYHLGKFKNNHPGISWVQYRLSLFVV